MIVPLDFYEYHPRYISYKMNGLKRLLVLLTHFSVHLHTAELFSNFLPNEL